MRKITFYAVASADSREKLEKSVAAYIEYGCEPFGNLVITFDERWGPAFRQPVVKYTEEK